jgi:hypothetical protein
MIGIAVARGAFLQPIRQKLQVDFDGLVAHESAVTLFSSECKREPDLGGSRSPEIFRIICCHPFYPLLKRSPYSESNHHSTNHEFYVGKIH